MEIFLDARKMDTKEETHEYLKEKFGFPDYYGNNLDALYDCLCEPNDYEVTIGHMESAGTYFDVVYKVMLESGIDIIEL